MSKRNKSKGKRINPTYWFFCEGETEAAYISFLKANFRLSIEINFKISGLAITEKYIDSFKRGKPTHEKDKNFLIYDGDIQDVLKRLQAITNATLIISNPSIELWFLYHYQEQKSAISTVECIKQLNIKSGGKYKKGILDPKLREVLTSKMLGACERSKKSQLFQNPSSNLFVLIEELDKAKK